MIQINMVAGHIVVTLFMQLVAQIDVVEGNLQLLIKATHIAKLLSADEKARRSSTYGVVDAAVVAKVMCLVVMHLLKLVHRTSADICNPRMLDEV